MNSNTSYGQSETLEFEEIHSLITSKRLRPLYQEDIVKLRNYLMDGNPFDTFMVKVQDKERKGTHGNDLHNVESPQVTSTSTYRSAAMISPTSEVIDLTITDNNVSLYSSSRQSKRKKVSNCLPSSPATNVGDRRFYHTTQMYSPKCRDGYTTVFSHLCSSNHTYSTPDQVKNEFANYCFTKGHVHPSQCVADGFPHDLILSIKRIKQSSHTELQNIYSKQTNHCIRQLIYLLNSMPNITRFSNDITSLHDHLDVLYKNISQKGLTINIEYAAFCAEHNQTLYKNYVKLIGKNFNTINGHQLSVGSLRVMLWLANNEITKKRITWESYRTQSGKQWEKIVCYPTDYLKSPFHRNF